MNTKKVDHTPDPWDAFWIALLIIVTLSFFSCKPHVQNITMSLCPQTKEVWEDGMRAGFAISGGYQTLYMTKVERWQLDSLKYLKNEE